MDSGSEPSSVHTFPASRVFLSGNAQSPSKISASEIVDVVCAVRELNTAVVPSCIQASAAVHDFFVKMNVQSVCLPVSVRAANWRISKLFSFRHLSRTVKALTHGLPVSRSGGADSEDAWAGHLVVVVDSFWLVDPTLDFLAPLDPDLRLAPLISDKGRSLLDGRRTTVELDGTFVDYVRDDQNQRYVTALTWGQASRTKMLHWVLGTVISNEASEAYRLLVERSRQANRQNPGDRSGKP